MSYSQETKRLWRRLAVFGVVGLLAAAALWVVFVRMRDDARRRRLAAANEQEAVLVIDSVAAAQQLYLEARGEYGTFAQLVEAGVFRAPLEGEALVVQGYAFRLRVTPRAEGRPAAFAVNADPVRAAGPDATGRRHFYADSDVTGVRFNDERPATAADPPLPRANTY
jgi:type II secretory pathway pseudopilin PulG